MATINEMRQVATQIENETQVGGNTANRVGGLFNDVVDKLESLDNGKQDNLTFDNVPTRNSSNPVTSDGIYNDCPSNSSASNNIDLSIADENGKVLAAFSNGYIRTKYFDASAINTHNLDEGLLNTITQGADHPVSVENNDDADLDFADEHGNVLVRFQNGYIRTKKFDAAKALSSNLYKKKMNIIGDSYVANHQQSYTLTWHYLIAQDNVMQYANYGINGNGLVASGSPTSGTPVVDRYSSMSDDADYVIVVGGKNDYNAQLSIANFKSGLATLCGGLVAKYAARGSKIAFFTPWDDYDSGADPNTIKLIEYVDAIIEVCGKYSIPVFDSSRKGAIFMYNATFRSTYCQGANDISHLNADGHKLFKNKAFNFLNQL